MSIILMVTLWIFPPLRDVVFSRSIDIQEQKVVYPLPYPGILSDHPLYPIKRLRDSILIFTTRDTLKKAELYHHLSDKHIAGAVQMEDMGKEQLAIKELERSQKLFSKVPPLLKISKTQGVGPTNDFIMRLYQSNAKHEELITEILKKSTQENIETLENLLQLNKENRIEIGKI